MGRYQHYKGQEYEVLFVAQHSETLEEMIVYQALYGDREMWVRSKAMFFEDVTRPDGTVQPRFKKLA